MRVQPAHGSGSIAAGSHRGAQRQLPTAPHPITGTTMHCPTAGCHVDFAGRATCQHSGSISPLLTGTLTWMMRCPTAGRSAAARRSRPPRRPSCRLELLLRHKAAIVTFCLHVRSLRLLATAATSEQRVAALLMCCSAGNPVKHMCFFLACLLPSHMTLDVHNLLRIRLRARAALMTVY